MEHHLGDPTLRIYMANRRRTPHVPYPTVSSQSTLSLVGILVLLTLLVNAHSFEDGPKAHTLSVSVQGMYPLRGGIPPPVPRPVIILIVRFTKRRLDNSFKVPMRFGRITQHRMIC